MKNAWNVTIKGFLAVLLLSLTVASLPAAESKAEQALATAQHLEEAFAAVADKAKPAVVVITNRQTGRRSMPFGRGEDSENFLPQEFFDFFGWPNPNRQQQREPRSRGQQRRSAPRQRSEAVGRGSGVLISADGFLVTNFHVIKDHQYLEVKTADGKVFDNEKDAEAVKVIGIDEDTDLAVLKLKGVKKESFPFLAFMDSDRLRVGQWAIAIGAPFELDYSVTVGCVSQTGRYNRAVSSFNNYIQTDASINPGNSGGPLLNIQGEIIGINQYIYTGGSRGNIGLGFAIASNVVKYVADSLIADGEVSRAFLGVAMQDLDEQLLKQFDVEYGVLVSDVVAGEAAEKAGVKPGDVIQKVAGREVTNSQELLQAVAKHRPGEDIVLSVVRNQKHTTFTIKAGRRQASQVASKPGEPAKPAKTDELDQLGLALQEQDGKIVVTEVFNDGAAAQIRDDDGRQVLAGDIIHDVNRNSVKSVADVREALKETRNRTVVLWLERKNPNGASMRFFLAIPLANEDK